MDHNLWYFHAGGGEAWLLVNSCKMIVLEYAPEFSCLDLIPSDIH